MYVCAGNRGTKERQCRVVYEPHDVVVYESRSTGTTFPLLPRPNCIRTKKLMLWKLTQSLFLIAAVKMNDLNGSSNSPSLDLQTSHAAHKMRVNEVYEDSSLSDIPAFLKEPRQGRKNNKLNGLSISRRSMESSCSSSMSLSSIITSDFDFCTENDEDEVHEQESQECLEIRGYFIPGITGTAKCLEGAVITGSTIARPTQRKHREASRCISRKEGNGKFCSVSSGGSGMSRETYHSISKNLEETRELIRRRCKTKRNKESF